MEERARHALNPKTSKCPMCEEADFLLGGICSEHEMELQAPVESLAADDEGFAAVASRCHEGASSDSSAE